MARLIDIHPDNPQARLITQVAKMLGSGGVVAYPSGLAYALGCCIGNKDALDRLGRVRALPKDHLYTIVCSDLSQVSEYGHISNSAYRLIRGHVPGEFTYILPATRAVPRRVMGAKRKFIGIRLASTQIVKALIEALGGPMISTTLRLVDDSLPLTDPYEIKDAIGHHLEAIIIGEQGLLEESTVVDMTTDEPHVLRQGIGQW